MKKPIYVSFSTQKGGIGKTTITVIVASYLHYVKGYNVAVIDCDFPQHSIVEMRERDVKMVSDDDYYKQMAYHQIKKLGKKGYPIIGTTPKDAIAEAERLTALDESLDIIFFDMAGTVNNQDIIHAVAHLDYIFTPIVADRVAMVSSLKYVSIVNDMLISSGKTNIKGLYLFWNMVDGREKTDLYEVYESAIDELGVTVMKTFIPNSNRFKKEVSNAHKPLFRSTIFPPDRSIIKGSHLDELTEEILQIMKIV